MRQKAEYRSALRSRESIRRAFAELIHEKGTTKVTVKELVERADVNRSTFYAHYQDIDAVRNEIEKDVVQKMFDFLDASEHTELLHNPLPFLLRIGAELERNRNYYRLLLESNGSGTFTQKLKDVFLERMLTDRNVFGKIRRQQEFLICMDLLAGGGVGLCCDWITGKIDMPMQELANIINEIAINTMKQFV
jgi:AcrR family transcriptional regulator